MTSLLYHELLDTYLKVLLCALDFKQRAYTISIREDWPILYIIWRCVLSFFPPYVMCHIPENYSLSCLLQTHTPLSLLPLPHPPSIPSLLPFSSTFIISKQRKSNKIFLDSAKHVQTRLEPFFF